ncbi:hypothetical protein LTR70_010047 [Exophiala xenobiotica]|nr:hypothetical protein LTR70_010047 [Exophiala xenobiotica]
MPLSGEMIGLYERRHCAKRAQKSRVQTLKQQVEDAKAQMGWLQARHVKEIRALQGTLEHRSQDHTRVKAELAIVESKVKRLEADNIQLRDDNDQYQVQLQLRDEEVERMKATEVRVRHTILQVNKARPLSTMEAAVRNDEPLEDLLERLQQQWTHIVSSQARTKQTHRKKLLAMRRDIDEEKQRFDDISQALDQKSAELPRASCGHDDHRAVAVTGCQRFLCEECYGQASKSLVSRWAIPRCLYCDRACPLLPISENLVKVHRNAECASASR